jgi:hypothetical protein
MHVTTCSGIEAQILACVNAQPATKFNIRLNCTEGGVMDCTGIALRVTGSVVIRPGVKCAKVTPQLFVDAGDATADPLFGVSGSRGSLEVRDVAVDLRGTRAGFRAAAALRLALSGVQVVNGTAERGAAVYAANTATSIAGGKLTGHTATKAGGAVFVTTDSSFTSTVAALKVASTNVLYNKAPLGGAIFVDEAWTTLSGVTVSLNKADYGGAIAAQSTRTDGRVVLTVGGLSYLESNAATQRGGALFLNNTRAKVGSSWVRYNSAVDGGAIAAVTGSTALNMAGPALTVTSTFVSYNTATGHGGGLFLLDARGLLGGAVMRGNEANSGNGGGVYTEATRSDPNNFIRLQASSNVRRAGSGRAWSVLPSNRLHACVCNPYLTLSALTLSVPARLPSPLLPQLDQNTALQGGGLHARDVKIELQSTYVLNNKATNEGGGVYVTTGWTTSEAVTIQGSVIKFNSVSLMGLWLQVYVRAELSQQACSGG